jgi:hypothetical protein
MVMISPALYWKLHTCLFCVFEHISNTPVILMQWTGINFYVENISILVMLYKLLIQNSSYKHICQLYIYIEFYNLWIWHISLYQKFICKSLFFHLLDCNSIELKFIVYDGQPYSKTHGIKRVNAQGAFS